MATGKPYTTVTTTGQKKGRIDVIHRELKKDVDHEWHMLGASVIKVHQDAMRSGYDKAQQAIGRSVGGLSSKMHVKVDAFGQLLKIQFNQMATELFSKDSCNYLLADKGYDKTARMYLTGVLLACIMLAIKL